MLWILIEDIDSREWRKIIEHLVVRLIVFDLSFATREIDVSIGGSSIIRTFNWIGQWRKE